MIFFLLGCDIFAMLLKQTSQAPGHNILGDSRKYPYHTMDGFFWNSEGKNWGVRVRGL